MIRGIWSVTFYVSNLKKAVYFYEKTLELNKKYEYSSYAGFDCSEMERGLTLKGTIIHRENSPCVEFSIDNVDATHKVLKQRGVKFIDGPHDKPWDSQEATFLDPDGNVLEIMKIDWEKHFNVAIKGFKKL